MNEGGSPCGFPFSSVSSLSVVKQRVEMSQKTDSARPALGYSMPYRGCLNAALESRRLGKQLRVGRKVY